MLTAPVEGGALAVAAWQPAGWQPGDGPSVVAAHGITSSHVFWQPVGERLAAAGVRLLAPDLRGRGLSADLPGPSSISQHAEDLVAVLDDQGLDRAVVVGHSMGGFVAAVTTILHPQRVAATLLVDGGPPLGPPLPPDADVEAILQGIIGPSLDRLRQRFDSPAAYRDFWRAHPAFAAVPEELVTAYADHDLVPDGEGRFRSRVSADRILEDARDTLHSDRVRGAVQRIEGPVRLLVAERGMLDGPEGLYPPAAVEAARAGNARLEGTVIRGVNHFTIGMSPTGADAVVQQVLAML